MRVPPWTPLVALVAVAATIWIMAEVPALRPAAVAAIGGRPNFALCGGPIWQRCVIDGDTIRYRGMTIRLADLNAPETHDPECAAEAALGRRATRRLQSLINEGPFELVRTAARDEDVHGRKLRDIRRDGRSLGEVLIAEGLARPWHGRGGGWCA